MTGVAPLLIKTAYNFATHPLLTTFLLDSVASDFIVELLEILILMAGE